jgi:branched-chain amino acid aminotransferase
VTSAWICIDGRPPDLVPLQDARIGVLDHGLTVGDGVFETCKVVEGRAFALSRHLRRLASGAGVLDIQIPDVDELRSGVDAVLGSTDDVLALGRLRITVTAGSRPLGDSTADHPPSIIVTAVPTTPLPPRTSAILVPWPRNERSPVASVKTTSYAESLMALRFARRAGASEAVLVNTREELCEGATSNVFGIVGGRLVTPALATGCLPGVTRELILEWFGGDEVCWSAEHFLSTVDAAFLTSSLRDIHPLSSLEARRWEAVDSTSARLAREFLERARDDIDP